jgi:hypothetical protein
MGQDIPVFRPEEAGFPPWQAGSQTHETEQAAIGTQKRIGTRQGMGIAAETKAGGSEFRQVG